MGVTLAKIEAKTSRHINQGWGTLTIIKQKLKNIGISNKKHTVTNTDIFNVYWPKMFLQSLDFNM